jgi:NAD(P)-dependent dehydrogenase (short-subunit alcohol dehydrogenase family)
MSSSLSNPARDAAELLEREAGRLDVLVNNACPGLVATDFTGFFGPRTPDQGAATAIRLATLPDDGPSGAFFEDEGVVPW